MKRLLLIAMLALSACASRPVVYQVPDTLREVYRGGELRGLETPRDANNAELYPGQYDLTQHVCTSMPEWDNYGQYVRTITKCW